MSTEQAGATSWWAHREAHTGPPTRPAGGAHSPAAQAAARRVAAAKDAEAFWEPHYAAMPPSTDGPAPGPNPVLVDMAAGLAAGTALDLGCGQGGDALWLAGRGWKVNTVGVSITALQRVAIRAERAGLSQRVNTQRHDLSATFPAGSFDLINAQYFHSPVDMDRPTALARAAAAVNPAGMLLIVDHASVPPWSWADPETVFPTPNQTLEGLRLDLAGWGIVTAENRDREAVGPGGQRAVVTDTIIARSGTAKQRYKRQGDHQHPARSPTTTSNTTNAATLTCDQAAGHADDLGHRQPRR